VIITGRRPCWARNRREFRAYDLDITTGCPNHFVDLSNCALKSPILQSNLRELNGKRASTIAPLVRGMRERAKVVSSILKATYFFTRLHCSGLGRLR
jgi:hypothetical protein